MTKADTPIRHGGCSEFTRRLFVASLGTALLVPATPALARNRSTNTANGHIRRLKMHCGQTDESINIVYWIDGEYIPEAMEEISYFMRDWREDKAIRMNKANIDILAATHQLLDTDEPFNLLSGYRTKKTNRMLRRRSRLVARNSLHVSGEAADVRLRNRSVSQIARAAQKCREGGVGKYSRSNFVHIDCGNVRAWGA